MYEEYYWVQWGLKFYCNILLSNEFSNVLLRYLNQIVTVHLSKKNGSFVCSKTVEKTIYWLCFKFSSNRFLISI